jgi:ADP-heptose:LPS heptosyltransferase
VSQATPPGRTASPLRGRYLVQNPLLLGWLRLADAGLAVARRRTGDVAIPQSPKRVLVCVGGHLGDAVIATKAIADLQRALPGVDIGVLSGSWNRPILDGHPRVRRFHWVDHWKTNRSRLGWLRRWLLYRRSHRRAARAIRAVGYDVALDLYAYYPNFAPTLAAAGVRARVGYDSGGFGPLYTHRLPWTPGASIAEEHRAVLQRVAPGLSWEDAVGYELGDIPPEAANRLDAMLGEVGLRRHGYAVLHVGSGLAHKQWPTESWVAVARDLLRRRIGVVLTGAGLADVAATSAIQAAVPDVVNLVDRLSWQEFRAAIAHARVTLTVDTVAMHVAAAQGAPCVSVVSGIEPRGRWAASSALREILTHPVACAPCFRGRGCAAMSCVRDVTPDTMLAAAGLHLGGDAP